MGMSVRKVRSNIKTTKVTPQVEFLGQQLDKLDRELMEELESARQVAPATSAQRAAIHKSKGSATSVSR